MATHARPRHTVSTALAATLVATATLHASGGSFDTTTPGLAGTGGVIPVLEGSGSACPGSTDNQLVLSDALAASSTTLIVGLSELAAPFRGGILGPNPDILLAGLPVDGFGEVAFAFDLPEDLPVPFELWTQFWTADGGADAGLSASNTLRITVDQFEFFPHFEDPNPEGFHPLGKKMTDALRFDEISTYFNNGDQPGSPFFTRDDLYYGAGATEVVLQDPTTFVAGGTFVGFRPRVGRSGDLNGDGDADAVYIGIDANGRLAVRGMTDPYDPGSLTYFSDYFGVTGVFGVSGDVGDVYGNGDDEVVVTESFTGPNGPMTRLMVFVDGGPFTLLPVREHVFDGDFGRVALAQLDIDDALEIVVATDVDPDDLTFEVSVFDDLAADMPLLYVTSAFTFPDVNENNVLQGVEIVPGQYDADPQDEIAVIAQEYEGSISSDPDPNAGRVRVGLTTFDPVLDDDGQIDTFDTVAAADSPQLYSGKGLVWDRHNANRVNAFVAADLKPEGSDSIWWIEEIRLGNGGISFSPSSDDFEIMNERAWNLRVRAINPLTDSSYVEDIDFPDLPFVPFFPETEVFFSTKSPTAFNDIVVVDPQGLGADQLGITLGGSSFDYLSLLGKDPFPIGDGVEYPPQQYLVRGIGGANIIDRLDGLEPTEIAQLPPSQTIYPLDRAPIMAAGDFDRENLRLRYTGESRVEVIDPIPLVLLAAPPTQEQATTQNLTLTGTEYGVSSGTGEAFTASLATSLSFSIGVTAGTSTPLGDFGAEITSTLDIMTETSTGTETTITTSQTYAGGFDADSIVFQGTTALIYEYEVVSAFDPLLVGEPISINVPSAATIFQFETDFYNSVVDLEDRVPDDVFTHTIGDVASYPSQGELTNVLASNGGVFEGWASAPLSVGQGQGTTTTEIEFETVLSAGDSVTYGVESSVNFVLGGPTFGSSVGLSESEMYEVSVGDATAYTGVIGNIDDTDEFTLWNYTLGMVVYTREGVGDDQPVQVVHYWTNPQGTGY